MINYRIRKVQNYEWADDYFRKGDEFYDNKELNKAIDCYKDAERLDDLNKDIYLKKGYCYLKLVNL